jgi:hypothetical protein
MGSNSNIEDKEIDNHHKLPKTDTSFSFTIPE